MSSKKNTNKGTLNDRRPMQVLSSIVTGNKNGFIAGLLIIAMCLPISTVALAASAPSAPESLTAVAGSG
jgi:hypothetical protein